MSGIYQYHNRYTVIPTSKINTITSNMIYHRRVDRTNQPNVSLDKMIGFLFSLECLSVSCLSCLKVGKFRGRYLQSDNTIASPAYIYQIIDLPN
jgi:hypothetical protein